MAEWCDACGTYLVTWEIENIRLRAEVDRLKEELDSCKSVIREMQEKVISAEADAKLLRAQVQYHVDHAPETGEFLSRLAALEEAARGLVDDADPIEGSDGAYWGETKILNALRAALANEGEK
jgi:hypothetical protein